jgi:hypothetical protein
VGALKAYAEWTRNLPDALTSIISFLVPPHGWELGDEPRMLIGFAWATSFLEEGAHALDDLRRTAPPDAEIVEPVLILASGILGSLFMPFLAITLLGLLNRSHIPREWRNRWWTNTALGICALLVITLGVQ